MAEHSRFVVSVSRRPIGIHDEMHYVNEENDEVHEDQLDPKPARDPLLKVLRIGLKVLKDFRSFTEEYTAVAGDQVSGHEAGRPYEIHW